MKQYAVIVEKGPSSYDAYVPDLPGCVAAGDTVEEVQRLIGEAIESHLDVMRAGGDPIPEPTTLDLRPSVFRIQPSAFSIPPSSLYTCILMISWYALTTLFLACRNRSKVS